ncbi:hypothetical protein DAI22_02g096950 [Oryza sativa Japonica Group]|nr:hypothetical protein DAI22_02g096950 [Oryza sativa Japonica Group]
MSCLIVVVLTRQQTQEIEMHTSNDLILKHTTDKVDMLQQFLQQEAPFIEQNAVHMYVDCSARSAVNFFTWVYFLQ